MLIDRVDVPAGGWEPDEWPWTVPAIRHVAEDGVTFAGNVTVLVGANGSGKSTLLEAIAEAYGMDVRGEHGGRAYGSWIRKSPLGESLRISRTTAGRGFTGRKAKGFFLRAETAFDMLAYMTEHEVQGVRRPTVMGDQSRRVLPTDHHRPIRRTRPVPARRGRRTAVVRGDARPALPDR